MIHDKKNDAYVAEEREKDLDDEIKKIQEDLGDETQREENLFIM